MSTAPTAVALLTVNEAAARLNVTPATIYRAISARALAHHKLGQGAHARIRIHPDDLATWLAAGRVDAR